MSSTAKATSSSMPPMPRIFTWEKLERNFIELRDARAPAFQLVENKAYPLKELYALRQKIINAATGACAVYDNMRSHMTPAERMRYGDLEALPWKLVPQKLEKLIQQAESNPVLLNAYQIEILTSSSSSSTLPSSSASSVTSSSSSTLSSSTN